MRRPASPAPWSRWLGPVGVVALFLSIPAGAGAQAAGTLLDRPARLEVRDLPLEKALTLLQRSSGVALAFSPDLLSEHGRVSCSCKAVTVAAALDRLLEGTGLRYRLAERKVIVGRWTNARPSPALGRGLAWGPHAVGHSTLELDGRDEAPRVSIWYPADQPIEGRRMALSDYYLFGSGPTGRRRLDEAVKEAARAGVDETALRRALATEGRAWAEAPPASGRFPVVAFAPGEGGPPFQMALLCELLASEGLVVVAAPSPAWSGRAETGTGALELAAAWLREAIGAAATHPAADPGRLGLLGYSFGGSVAALVAMTAPGVDALVLVDPGFRVGANYDVLTRARGFDPGRLDEPLLVMLAGGVPQVPDPRLLAAAPARRLTLSFPRLRHGDFSSLVDELITLPLGNDGGRDLEAVAAGHDAAARYAAAFLLSELARDAGARSFLDRTPSENGLAGRVVVVERRTPSRRP